MTSSEAEKLAELRAKTDRQLIALIDWMLDLGLRLAREERKAGRAKAERAWREAVKLLPAIYNLGEADCRRLHAKMLALREMLAGCASAAA